jgi:hypothetical protein
MIADYFNNFDLGALVSGGNSGNVCNITSEAAKNGPLPVTILDKTVKLETVTAGNSKRSVTDVTSTAVAAVTALQPATPRIDTASAAMLPPLPLLPHQRPCYCCKGIDYWLAGTEKYPHWICRKCHPPAPGAERKL